MRESSENHEIGRGSLPTARLEQRGTGDRLRRAGRDLGTWSARRVKAVGYVAGRIAPAVLMATFVGAVSVGLAVLTDTRSSSHHDLQWQQWKHDFSELQQTLEMSERIRLSNERIQPLLDSLTADRLLRQQESRWAPRTTVHDSRLVIEPPPPVVLEVPLPEAALIEGQRREVQFPEVQLPDLEQLDQLKVDPRDLERLLETPSRTRSPATFNE